MAFTTGKCWSFRIAGEVIALGPAGGGGTGHSGRLAPVEAAWAIDRLAPTAPGQDELVRRDLVDALSSIGVTGEASRMSLVSLRSAVSEALIRERLIAFRTSRPTVVEAVGKVEPLGWDTTVEENPDVFLLVAEVTVIGDTPLIDHAVRILDPDTGEVVVETMTDENGIVRTEVPANKSYRIEIVDHEPDLHAPHTISTPHPMLRCRFVDAAGSPVPDVEATVKDLEGHEMEVMADDEGLLEMPAKLGLYEVTVGDEPHWVHSILHSDGADDAYEIIVASELEEGQDGIDPHDRLARSWEYEDDDDDDDIGGGILS